MTSTDSIGDALEPVLNDPGSKDAVVAMAVAIEARRAELIAQASASAPWLADAIGGLDRLVLGVNEPMLASNNSSRIPIQRGEAGKGYRRRQRLARRCVRIGAPQFG